MIHILMIIKIVLFRKKSVHKIVYRIMMKSIFVVCLITFVVAAEQQQRPYYNPYINPYSDSIYQRNYVPIVSQSNEINPDGSFSYGYESADGKQVEARGILRPSTTSNEPAEVIEGSYQYVAPDGTPIVVKYIADENGFHPQGSHIPTPPPIPEAIQKSLNYIAQTEKTLPREQPLYYRGYGAYPQYPRSYYQNYNPYTYQKY